MAAKWVRPSPGRSSRRSSTSSTGPASRPYPEPYGAAAQAFNRYFMYYGGITDGDTLLTMFGDFADLWERAAADGMPLREIVGDDPVEFAETFAQAYSGKRWIDKERARLTKAIEDAEPEEQK